MSWKPDRYGALRALVRGRRVDEEVLDEFEHHLAMRIEANMRRGMSADAAREDALRRFGNVQMLRDETIEIDESVLREQKRMEILDTFRREVKQSVRSLRKSPGFTLVTVLTLALGIGATTAVFTLLKAVVLDPLPYPEPERLVKIVHPVPGYGEKSEWNLSSASYLHFKNHARVLEDLGVYDSWTANLRAKGDATMGEVMRGTPNLFPLLGARAVVGRLFQDADGVRGAPSVALLSHGYWEREYGSDPTVVGTTLSIDGDPVEIVGVLDERFMVPDRKPVVFIPRRINPAGPHWNQHSETGIGKLANGVTLEAATAELRALTPQLREEFPTVYYAGFFEQTKMTTAVKDLRSTVVGLDVARILWVVLGSVGVVLLIACANVANLFLVRTEARRNELAVRSALGAERAHLFVQALSEAMLLSMTAVLAGVWFAYGGLRLLLRLAPSSLPRLEEVQLGWPAVWFAVGLGIVAALVFALFPVVRRAIDYAPLREGGRGLTGSRRQLRVRSALVTAQIALALVLLAAAGLMLRSFQQMRNVELGFDPKNVLTLEVALPYLNYKEHAPVAQFWETFQERVRGLPGVNSVGGTIALPIAGGAPCAILMVDPMPADPQALGCPAYNIVTPGFFESARIKVRGRTPTWDDIHSGSGAVVIGAALAERLWPGEDPIGRGVRVASGTAWYRIVGVADDIRARGATEPPPEVIYYPIQPIEGAPLWQAQNALVITVRSNTARPEQFTGGIRSILRELEPSAALGSVEPWQHYVNESMIKTTFTMILLGTAGGMALLLAIVGLYGVIAYTVNRRRNEIGIRLALGAPAAEVGGSIVMASIRMGAIGVAIGLVAAFLTTQTMASLLFEVKPTDGLTLTVVSFTLLGVAALASFIPARRATRVSPLEALRME